MGSLGRGAVIFLSGISIVNNSTLVFMKTTSVIISGSKTNLKGKKKRKK